MRCLTVRRQSRGRIGHGDATGEALACAAAEFAFAEQHARGYRVRHLPVVVAPAFAMASAMAIERAFRLRPTRPLAAIIALGSAVGSFGSAGDLSGAAASAG